MRNNKWAKFLAYVTGSVNQELLLQNEYLAAENRILRAKLPARLRLNDPERATLGEIGKRVGRTALREIVSVARPDTILAWYRRLVGKKFDGSKRRQYPGRPRVQPEVEALVVRMAKKNTGWGYDRIVRALANLVTKFRIKRWETFCAATASVLLRRGAEPHHGRISSRLT